MILVMQPPKNVHSVLDLEAEAKLALDRARAMPRGSERSEALKEAGRLQWAADLTRILEAVEARRRKARVAQG